MRYGAIAFSIGCIAGISGRITALYVAYKYNKPSIVIYAQIFFAVLAFGANIYNLATESLDFTLHPLCP
jgi:hypothetical protein